MRNNRFWRLLFLIYLELNFRVNGFLEAFFVTCYAPRNHNKKLSCLLALLIIA